MSEYSREFTSKKTAGSATEITVKPNANYGDFTFEISDRDFHESLMVTLTREQAEYLALYIRQCNREAGYVLPPPPEE